MGEKGAKLTGAATDAAEEVVDRLASLGEVTSKKMFGGVGIFVDGAMFALIDSGGSLFFKVGETNEQAYAGAGSERHGRMPYAEVPAEVWADDASLVEWAGWSADLARS